MLSWDASDMWRLEANLRQAGLTAAIRGAAVVSKAALDIEARAKMKAPVDTGNLRASISSDIRGLEAEIGPTASYAAFVEFGTSRMSPQPFLGPAFDEVEPRFIAAVEKLGGSFL